MDISGNIIAAIIYDTAKGIYTKLKDPLKAALVDTDLFVHKLEHVFPKQAFEKILSDQHAVEALKQGEKIIDSDKLAIQFAIFGGFYTEPETEILPMARKIVDYFTERFESRLLEDPRRAQSYILSYIKRYGQKQRSEHQTMISLLWKMLERMPPQDIDAKTPEEMITHWWEWKEDMGAALSQRELGGHGPLLSYHHPLNNPWGEFITMPPWRDEVQASIRHLKQAAENLGDPQVSHILEIQLSEVKWTAGDETILQKLKKALAPKTINQINGRLADIKKKALPTISTTA